MYTTIEEELIDIVNIEDFLDFAGLTMKRLGKTMRSPCPIHHGDHPQAFSFDRQKKRFTCYTHCGSIGTIIHVYAKLQHIPYQKAVRELAKWQGISTKGRTLKTKAPTMVEKKRTKEERMTIETLPLVSKKETYGLTPLHEHPSYSKEVIDRFCLHLGVKGRYSNRLVFPIHDLHGRWVGNSGRWVDDTFEEQGIMKYLDSKEPFQKTHVLYGMHLAKDAPEWIIHEGPKDTIAAYMHGFEAISTLGAFLSPEQVELLRQHRKPIVLGYDGDKRGREATCHAIRTLLTHHLTDVTVMLFGKKKDPDLLTKDEYTEVYHHKIPGLVFLTRYSK